MSSPPDQRSAETVREPAAASHRSPSARVAKGSSGQASALESEVGEGAELEPPEWMISGSWVWASAGLALTRHAAIPRERENVDGKPVKRMRGFAPGRVLRRASQ